MAFNQIRITGINAVSGVYQVRLNFDNNVKWETEGSHATVNSQIGLIDASEFSSSRLTAELESALGSWDVEINENPNLWYSDGANVLQGCIFREAFEEARQNGYLVHVIVARYTNDLVPEFIEFIFAGSTRPNELTVFHRRVPPDGSRRHETLSFSVSPASRFEKKLGGINWTESDMSGPCYPNYLSIICEPGEKTYSIWRSRNSASNLYYDLKDGAPFGDTVKNPKDLTAILGYGMNPYSANPDVGPIRDNVGIGPFPTGNWNILFSSAINKVCEYCDVVWDGVMPPSLIEDGAALEFRKMRFDNTIFCNVDDGEVDPAQQAFNWNYGFGYSPIDGTTFKSPVTYDVDMIGSDFLKGVAAWFLCRIDKEGTFTSEGLPIIRLIPIGYSAGEFPNLPELPGSSEDAFITDADGVEIERLGFEGTTIAPSNSKHPVKFTTPFGSHMIAYETSYAFDESRFVIDGALEFQDQWQCGHRGPLTVGSEDDPALNPNSWKVAAHVFYYENDNAVKIFPDTLDYLGYASDTEDVYHSIGWSGYNPIQAIYERPAGELTDAEKRERQQNPRLAPALALGRYVRGERRQLSTAYLGVVGPNWADLKTGMTREFTPVDTPITYAVADMRRKVFGQGDDVNITSVIFEEVNAVPLEMTYRNTGDLNNASGSIGGGTANNPGLSNTSDFTVRDVRFYSGGVVVKTLSMRCFEYYDADNDRTLVQFAVPAPYEEQSGSTYGFNSIFQLHYKGTETFGNVEVVGLSEEGVPDYWAAAVVQLKRDSNTNVYYDQEFKLWSEDAGDWSIKRVLEKCNINRRLQIQGRIKAYWNSASSTLVPSWVALNDADFPMSDGEITTNSDLFNGTPGTPTLSATAGSITLNFGSRIKPVALSCSCAVYEEPGLPPPFTHTNLIGTMPMQNGVPTVNQARIFFWNADLVAQTYTWNAPVSPPLTDDPSTGAGQYVYVDVWGQVEIVGDNAMVF